MHTIASVNGPRALRTSDVVLTACVAVCAATVVTGLVAVSALPDEMNPYDNLQYALRFPCVLVGAFVARRAPRHPLGWLLLFAGWGVWSAAAGYAVLTRGWIHTEWLGRTVYAVATSGWVWCRGIVLVLVPMLYPYGAAFTRRATPYRRVLAVIGATTVAAACLFQIMTQVPVDFATGELPSWTRFFQDGIETVFRALWVVSIVAVVDLVVRVAALDRAGRRAHLPIAAGGALLLVGPLVAFASEAGIVGHGEFDWAEVVATALFVVVLAYGVVRRGVLGFETVVRRTALYSGITVVAAAIYVGVVGVFAAVLQDGVGRGPVVATGVVAVSLQPARAFVQRLLDRSLFGDRDDPYRALSGLNRSVGTAAGDPLAMVAETVRSSLRLPAVAIEVPDQHGDPVVVSSAVGHLPGGVVERVPIVYEGLRIGTLAVTLPVGEAWLGADDARLLGDLAAAAGAVVQSALLAADLARSRDGIVRAREEERRRLRHDLHDGLGPTLASVAMGLDAAASRLADHPELADLLRDLDRALQDAIADIRRLVYGLRPPALDDLGLVAAVRQQADEMTSRSGGRDARSGLAIELVASDLPPLGAAVEVAAYRVAVEAMTNVVRHSGASRCTVRLVLDDALVVSVEDDGRGVAPGAPAGVGFESMRNRAEELGGTLTVDARPGGGTVLVARLPVGDQVPS